MSSVIVAGNTSGSVTLDAPAVSGSTVITLPTTSGTMATLTTPSFTTTIGVGGATPSASGAGITFPATQSASTNANTLDDYEEGTWTPTISFGFGTTGQTYAARSGYYTKIGNLVTATCYAAFSAKGSAVGAARLEGLPFTIGQYSTTGVYINDISFSGIVLAYAEATTTYLPLLQQAAAGGGNTNITNSNCTNNSSIMIGLSYRV